MKLKLLIADDEGAVRSGIARYIEMHTDRFEILTAADGGEASEIIFHDRPEVMLLDIQMPVKDGVEVMREASRAGILPVTMILSGYDEFKYAQQAIRCGARDYLLKPCRSTDILQKLLDIADELDRARGEESEGQHVVRNSFVEEAREYIGEHYQDNLTLETVAEHVGITPGYLSTLFSQNTDMSFVEYLNQVRIEHARIYLTQYALKTYEIAYKVGFRDEKYFSKVFRKMTGMTPSEYRKSSQ